MRGKLQESFLRGECLEKNSAWPDEAKDHNKIDENVTNPQEPTTKRRLSEDGNSVSADDRAQDSSPSRECLY